MRTNSKKFHFYLNFLQIMKRQTEKGISSHPFTYGVNRERRRLVSPRQNRNDCERSTKALNKGIDLKGQQFFLSYLF